MARVLKKRRACFVDWNFRLAAPAASTGWLYGRRAAELARQSRRPAASFECSL